MAAPSIWPSASTGLIARPQSTALTSFSTRTSPVSVSTSTSANCAVNGGGDFSDTAEAVPMICCWSVTCREFSATSRRVTERPSGVWQA